MILRRITEHVKAQNWTAVALDFVIVVVGVFVGLQVQEWAEEQDRRKTERTYTMRLHDEVINLQATRAPMSAQRHLFSNHMTTATALIFGDDDRALTAEECRSIIFSAVVSNPTDELASLLELQSSGGLSLFQNEDVLSELRSFLLTRARARDANAGIARDIIVLSSAHPHLMAVLSPSDFLKTPTPGVYECDLNGMRASPAFRNDYELNQGIFSSHVRYVGLVDESLANLHQVLDEVLGIAHEELQ